MKSYHALFYSTPIYILFLCSLLLYMNSLSIKSDCKVDTHTFQNDNDKLEFRRSKEIQGGSVTLEHHSGKSTKPPHFIIYRLIGNDIPPLQCTGQLYLNTLYTLDHEPELRDCKKRWVLNNIVNTTERALILDLLISRGYTLDDIIIRRINYTKLSKLPKKSWTSAVTAQNEARNLIIRHGIRSGARWILAFDGNQFYTKQAWESITTAADRWEKQGIKYFKVPMYRVYSKQDPRWLNENTNFSQVQVYAPVLWESQLAFRNDSEVRYTEGMVYGKDNKLEMLDRLCGTGKFGIEGKKSINAANVDTGLCGCHKEIGNDRRQRDVKNNFALFCGYSVRLWYHPCDGVDSSRIFVDKRYRARLREKGRMKLGNYIDKEVRRRVVKKR